MPDLPYAIYDADNHYYEPDDCFTRHIEAKYARRTVWLDRRRGVPARMYVATNAVISSASERGTAWGRQVR